MSAALIPKSCVAALFEYAFLEVAQRHKPAAAPRAQILQLLPLDFLLCLQLGLLEQ